MIGGGTAVSRGCGGDTTARAPLSAVTARAATARAPLSAADAHVSRAVRTRSQVHVRHSHGIRRARARCAHLHQLHWHPLSLRLREPAQGQCSRQEARGAHPRTPAGSGEQRTWGARGAHPRTPAGRRLACEQDARDAETHGWAVLSRVGVMACEYSFIVLGLTSQRSRPPSLFSLVRY